MLTLKIENEKVENIFLNEFHSNSEKFLDFIQKSYTRLKSSTASDDSDNELKQVQEQSMVATWDNDKDKVWDEL